MTTKPKLAVPTKAQFRAYLQTLAFNEVSRFCKSGRCPLAQYIADNSTGFPKDTHFLVDMAIYMLGRAKAMLLLPAAQSRNGPSGSYITWTFWMCRSPRY